MELLIRQPCVVVVDVVLILSDAVVQLKRPVVVKGIDGDVHEEYLVDKIIAKRMHRKKVQYLVHWLGYGVQDRTWEPLENLANAEGKLAEFEMSQSKK